MSRLAQRDGVPSDQLGRTRAVVGLDYGLGPCSLGRFSRLLFGFFFITDGTGGGGGIGLVLSGEIGHQIFGQRLVPVLVVPTRFEVVFRGRRGVAVTITVAVFTLLLLVIILLFLCGKKKKTQ